MKKEVSQKRFFTGMAFYAILFLAVALLINLIASNGSDVFSNIANIIQQIAQALAYLCACISAYGYIRSKRNVAYIILYIIACIMIATFVILPIFGI